MADEIENNDSSNVELENDNSSNVNESTDDVETLKEQNRQLFARAKKAEGFELKDGKWLKSQKPEVEKKPEPEKQGLSTSDMYALIENKIAQEDITEVEDYAKLKGISIAEALKSNVVKNILSDKADERKAAEAASTSTKRGTQKPSEEKLLEKAYEGNLPSSDEDIKKLAELRIQNKKKK